MDIKTVKIVKVKSEEKISLSADVVIEEPLLIVVNDSELATLMRTPGSDKELAVGFLFSEGLISGIDDISMIDSKGSDAAASENAVNVKLRKGVALKERERLFEVRSSCGICGQKKIDDLFCETGAIKNTFQVNIADLYKMPELMSASQEISQKTRGAHAAAFFTKGAEMTACFEDIGRHNALDKLIGHCLVNYIKMDDKVLVLSGRASYEMLAKALRCSISFVASVSAPSTLAVDIAKRANIALAGIIRGDTMNIYSREDDFVG